MNAPLETLYQGRKREMRSRRVPALAMRSPIPRRRKSNRQRGVAAASGGVRAAFAVPQVGQKRPSSPTRVPHFGQNISAPPQS
jgi:hypothetical protein